MQAERMIRGDRRAFIKASALAGGGVLFGFSLRGLGAEPDAVDARLNAYVRIDPSGRITFIMPRVEMGQGIYTAHSKLIAEELEVGLEQIHVEPAPPDPATYGFNGDQSTGTSNSIVNCWLSLRTAGATARMMLVSAAANAWGVPPAACRAENGTVVHVPTGRRQDYGALAASAARLPVPTEVALKEAKDFRLIGRSHLRIDAPAKIDGSARFGIDVRLPGLRYAAVALSPVEGGWLASFDEPAARAVKGVRQIVNENEFVAVVADNTWAALRGLEALNLGWNDGPNGAVQQAGLVAELEAAAQRPGTVATRNGDPEAALRAAATRVDAIFHQPFLAHATLEPLNCTVHWQNGECDIWVGSQAPDRVVAKLAPVGFTPGQVRVHNQLIGGGFGRRLEVDSVIVAVRIARHVDGPVQVLYRREEDMRHDQYRPYYVDRLSAGLDAAGTPVAWTHTIAGSSADARWYGVPLRIGVDYDATSVSGQPPYALPNISVAFVQQEPVGVPTGYWRGVGATRSVFVVECFIDELAVAARQDPVAYRRALITDPRLRAVLDLAAAKAGWGGKLPPGRGRGVSVQFAFGSYLAQVAEVVARADGSIRVERVVCAFDCGQAVNPDTIHAQLEGGVIFGLSAVLMGEITVANGRVQQGNFDDYPILRCSEVPRVESYLITSTEAPGGVGETGTAGIGAAVCNAVFAATGKRVHSLPLSRSLKA